MANHQLDPTDLGDTRGQVRLARKLAPAHGPVGRARGLPLNIYPWVGQSLGMEGFIAFSIASVHIHSS